MNKHYLNKLRVKNKTNVSKFQPFRRSNNQKRKDGIISTLSNSNIMVFFIFTPYISNRIQTNIRNLRQISE